MRSITMRLLCVSFVFWLMVITAAAQTGSKPAQTNADSDQLLKDILSEVRQMRAEMQRANVYSHRSQVLLERIKVEQEQIARFTRDVADARDQIEIVRKQLATKQVEFDQATKKKSAGMIGPTEFGVINGQLEELQQHEQNLLSREALISAELDVSKATLADLNKRLDDLDREISQPANDAGGQPAKKKP